MQLGHDLDGDSETSTTYCGAIEDACYDLLYQTFVD